MPFKQITDKINYHELETEVLKFWDDQGIFAQSISAREGAPSFTFYEGPPTANGKPGIHHVMARMLKDLICRYKTMQGYQVHRKAGWDTHGLPVEIEVEKMLGFKHKDDIVEYGVAKFNEECRRSVWKYKTEWEELTRTMGYWVDLDHPYITFENNYIESIWWALKQYFDKEMIYKGYKIQPYCPRCETPLSSHEVSLGYKDVKDPSVYVKLKVKGEENTYFLVWTTTPWTLISNVALAVHPDVDYVKVDHKGQNLILAEARLSVLGEEYTVLEKCKGSALLGKEYGRLFSYHQVKEKGWYVVGAEFVTTGDGSGIVHMAPAYGEDDYQMGRKYGLPTIHPVNKSGEFNAEVTDFAGKFVKDADPEIIADLKQRGLLYKKEQYLHSYPHCWRCSSPLLYYARESWYIRTTAYAQRMIDLNKTINWIPGEVGSGRFGNWLEENKDWALSRDRFWGTPLPIWVCEKCGKQECIGSIAELEKASGLKFRKSEDEEHPGHQTLNPKPETSNFKRETLNSKPLDLHKPFVDEITWECTCGGVKKRTPELIDVWFDSGAMPFAQWHYPFENKEIFDRSYPADYISEGIDQTRGWFYTLHSIGTFLFDKPAYKNVLVNELILDKQGQKMSKTKGNSADPFMLIKKYGADATRWYLVANSPVWRPTLFDEEGVAEVQRKFFSTLVNTYAFFALYANIDGFQYKEDRIPVSERAEIDRWILSELNSLVGNYTQWMDAYDVTRAARAVSDFTIDQLSNWYVRRNRRRFWKSEQGRDKTAAYQTLYECLVAVAKLMAPFAPFLADELYRNLNGVANREGAVSVHLTGFPIVEEGVIDAELELRMERAIKIVGLVRAMRMKSNLKVRQPLKKIILPIANEGDRAAIKRMEEVILEEINVKQIEYVTDDSGIVKKKAKPNFRSLGEKFGKGVQPVAARIRELTGKEIGELERNGSLNVPVNGAEYAITREDIEILHEDLQGWMVESDGSVTVALDTELTEELLDEGLAREFVSRIQNIRKDSGLEVMDRIKIYIQSSDRMAKALGRMSGYVRQETLAVELSITPPSNVPLAEEEINDELVSIAIEKVKIS
ncbi:MAG: isoleucine--tRNA ligase [Ignavibacteriales bacterium]|nr:isoleucine--tRNA ligase [Ignavibacteriales bacterium]